MEKYDVLVAGAGIAGVSAAYYLAREGLKVCLAEGDSPCAGATGACNGALSYLGKSGYELQAAAAALPMYRELGVTLHLQGAMDMEREVFFLGITGEDRTILETMVAGARECGLPASMLTAREVSARIPGLHPQVRFAAWSPGGMQGVVDPFRVTLGLLEAFREMGGTYRTARVEGLEMTGDSFVAAHTSAGRIPAESFVNCTGIRVDGLWPREAMGLGIFVQKGTVLVTQPVPDLYPGNILNGDFMKKDPPVITLAVEQSLTGNLLIGAAKERDVLTREVSREIVTGIADNLGRYLTGLEELTVIRAYAGHRATRPEGYFAGRIPETQNLFALAGFGSGGITLGPAAGRFLAESIRRG